MSKVTEMSSLLVANTIRKQLKAGFGIDKSSGAICMMSWGADQFSGSAEETEDCRGFLQFRVNGAKFKGLVKIKLTWMVSYKIEFWKGRGVNMKIVDTIEDIYFPELTPSIDYYVEAERG